MSASLRVRHTITMVIEGDKEIVDTVVPHLMGHATQFASDNGQGKLRVRSQSLVELLDDDGNVVPPEVIRAIALAHKNRG